MYDPPTASTPVAPSRNTDPRCNTSCKTATVCGARGSSGEIKAGVEPKGVTGPMITMTGYHDGMMRGWIIALFVVALSHGQTSRDNAMCVFPWLEGNVDPSTPNLIATCQSMGIDTIYLHLYRTTGAGTGILYMADESGTWNAANGSITNYCTLSSFIAQAHAARIHVVGVIGCFLDPTPLPGNAAHEQLLRNVVDYLLHTFDTSGNPRYALDGIALDRVRYYGGAPSATPVTNFVASMKALCGPIPLHAFLIASPFYIDGSTYNGSFLSYTSSRNLLIQDYGQDWEALAPWLDVYAPMAYVADGGVYGTNYALMQSYCQKVAQFTDQACANAGVVRINRPTLRAYTDTSGTTTVASLDACMLGALAGGADGFAIYRWYLTNNNASWMNAIAARCSPGPDRPIAAVTSSAASLTLNLNASTVFDGQDPTTALTVRFDYPADGAYETAWSTTKTAPFLASGPGQHIVAVEVKDSHGLTNVRLRRASTSGNSLLIAPATMSVAAGGTTNLTVSTGVAGASLSYLIAASASGTSPTLPIGNGVFVPLVPDPFTDLLFTLINTPVAPGFAGVVPGLGVGLGQLVIPAGAAPPSLAGVQLRFAAVGFDPVTTLPRFATNPVTLTLLP
ncbi:MAG: hypothetical protein RIS21_895 [Planctomycetota bacterium]